MRGQTVFSSVQHMQEDLAILGFALLASECLQITELLVAIQPD